MRIETFNRAALLICTAFPDRKFEAEIYFELLKDLPDEAFLKAVVGFCKDRTELYPGSNLIAILRERTQDLVKNQSFLKLPAGERFKHGPDPAFKALIKSLADKK